jgi:hypothetical protein
MMIVLHILEDPFVILLEEVNNLGSLKILRIGLMDKILNELSVKRLWNKKVQRKRTVDRMMSWLHWDYDFT